MRLMRWFLSYFFENYWAYTINAWFRFTVSPSSRNREQSRAVFMLIMKVNISADNFLKVQGVWLHVIMPMHECNCNCSLWYFIVHKNCNDLVVIWPTLPVMWRLWARIPSDPKKNLTFFSTTFFSFLIYIYHIRYMISIGCSIRKRGIVFLKFF